MSYRGLTNKLGQAGTWAAGLLLIVGAVAGGFYLIGADYEPDGFLWIDGPLFWLLAAWVVATMVGLMSSTFDHVPWYGEIPAPAADGYAWRRSIRSRFEVSLNVVNLWAGPGFAKLSLLAWSHQDYGRAVVAGLFTSGYLILLILSLRFAFSLKPVLSIDRDGIRGPDVPGGSLPWDRVERFVVNGNLDGRRVTLMTRLDSGAPGPARTLELAAAGIPARRFLHLVDELAPQVEIQWPQSRFAAFSEA